MRTLSKLIVAGYLVPLVTAVGFATPDPIQWWRSTQADPTAYDLTVTEPPDVYYCYQWTVIFNGTTLLPSPQHMKAFAVCADDATLCSANNPTGWTYSTPADPAAGDLVIEWRADNSSYFVAEYNSSPGFRACFSEQLDDPYYMTAIHVGSEPDSAWVNPTPELGTWALLAVGGVVTAAAEASAQEGKIVTVGGVCSKLEKSKQGLDKNTGLCYNHIITDNWSRLPEPVRHHVCPTGLLYI